MGRAKDIRVKVIPAKIANDFVKKNHYSGKVVQNSQLHFGAFLDGRLHGVMSYGPSLDKKKISGLVSGTGWNEFIELNRMAFDDVLPKNSESRCISISMKLLKKNAPHIKWVISFADGTQCGDGTIYRASGFSLVDIKSSDRLIRFKDGVVAHALCLTLRGSPTISKKYNPRQKTEKECFSAGLFEYIEGFQLKYVYFLDPNYKEKLTCPILPFSKIDEMNARMYKGVKQSPRSRESVASGVQPGEGGANPTLGLSRGVKNAI
jgi:hypothetical protein